jgi:hypothetical protein
MTAKVFDGTNWNGIKAIKVRSDTTWNTIKQALVRTSAGTWQTIFTSITKVEPTVSSSETVTYQEVTFVVTQGDAAQYAENPATTYVRITKFNSTNVQQSQTTTSSVDRVASFVVTGLAQGWTVQLEYRLDYGSSEYLPEGGTTYYTTSRTTSTITKVIPTVAFLSRTFTSITFTVNKNTADTASWTLTGPPAYNAYTGNQQSGTVSSSGTQNVILSSLQSGLSYDFVVTNNYTANFDPAEQSAPVTLTQSTAVPIVANPVLSTLSGYPTNTSIGFNVNIGDADNYTYVLKDSANTTIASQLSGITSATLTFAYPTYDIYPSQTYTLTVTSYFTSAPGNDVRTASISQTTSYTAPTVSSTESTAYTTAQFTVSQNGTSYAALAGVIQMYATVVDSDSPPQGRNFSGNLSASSAVSPVSVSSQSTTQTVGGLQQGWNASFRYRISFGGGKYYPTDGSYLIDTESMSTITKVSPTITFVGSSGYSGLTFTVDGGNADNVSYELQNTAGTPIAGKTGTITAANYNTNFTITGLIAGGAYKLSAYGNYTSNFDPDETSSSTLSGTANVDIQTAVNPTITFTSTTAANTTAPYRASMTWSINLNGADSGQYRVYSVSGANYVVAYTAVPAGGSVTASSLYADEDYRCEVVASWSNANVDQTSATRTNTTNGFGTVTNPSIAINSGASLSGRSVSELMFTLSGGTGNGAYYHLDDVNGPVVTSSTTGTSVNIGGLEHNTSYTLYVQKYDSRYRTTRTAAAENSTINSTRPASGVSTSAATQSIAFVSSTASTLTCTFAGYGTGSPDGARRYIYRATSSAGASVAFFTSNTVLHPTTSRTGTVSSTSTQNYYYQGRWEQTYASIITGTAQSFSSNGTFGFALKTCTSTPAYLLASRVG